MTDYPHRLVIAVPPALADDANALMLAIGEQPGDARTFTGNPDETGYYTKGTLVRATTAQALTDPDTPLTAPDYAPDADLAAAERARAALSFSGPATADTIAVRLDTPTDAALADMGLTEDADE